MASNSLGPHQFWDLIGNAESAGRDIHKIKELVSYQTKEMIKSQGAHVSAIVASQEQVSYALEEMSGSISAGFENLTSAFTSGISEVVSQIEQNRKVLEGIARDLHSPRWTEAQEKKRDADGHYDRGKFDFAEAEYLEAIEKYKYDFVVHISLGKIYQFQTKNYDKATSCFDMAVECADKQSPFYVSIALSHKAQILYIKGEFAEAEACTAKAVELSPTLSPAVYQQAQYNAKLRNTTKACDLLERAINLFFIYSVVVRSDEEFDPIRTAVEQRLAKMRDEDVARGKSILKTALMRSLEFEPIVETRLAQSNVLYDQVRSSLHEASDHLRTNTLVGGHDANKVLAPLANQLKEFKTTLVDEMEADLSVIKREIVQDSGLSETAMMWIIVPISIFVSLIASLPIAELFGFGDFATFCTFIGTFLGTVVIVISILSAPGEHTFNKQKRVQREESDAQEKSIRIVKSIEI